LPEMVDLERRDCTLTCEIEPSGTWPPPAEGT
jgi:hypothetical protein